MDLQRFELSTCWSQGLSELYPVLILKGLGRLLMARFTPHSCADVAQNLVEDVSQLHAFLLPYSRVPTVARSASGVRWGDRDKATIGGFPWVCRWRETSAPQ